MNFLINQLNNYLETDWNFSGGEIDDGETIEKALLRELYEELESKKLQNIGQISKTARL